MQEAVRTPPLKYPWQQAVLDAFMEFQPENLPAKIGAAEQAISARLRDPDSADPEEHTALQDAWNSLRVLLSGTKLPRKKEIA
jgi:hypothetical protein